MSNASQFYARIEGFYRKNSNLIENIFLAFWLTIAIGSILTHELWRDEVRSMMMVIDIDSIKEFFTIAKYDGHPVLWRAILAACYSVIPHPVVLQLAALIIGFLTVWVFLKFAPFPLWFRILFIFGIIPLSINTVFSRNYGISMLLFFLFAYLVTQPVKRPITTGIILFLLANTNSFGMYMSGLLLGFWIYDTGLYVVRKPRYLAAILINLTGILTAYFSTRAGVDTLLPPPEHIAQIEYGRHFFTAFVHPGSYISHVLNLSPVYRDIFMVLVIAGLAVVRPMLGLTAFIAVILFNFVGSALLTPQPRHQGVLIGFMMTCYWLAYLLLKSEQKPPLFKYSKHVYLFSLYAMWVPFMLHNIALNRMSVVRESITDMSSGQAIGMYIRSNAQLSNAIIIGSPDYKLQTIGYYASNRIYLAREKRFRKFVKYSKDYKVPMKLSELLDTAKNLNERYQTPVLIALGYFGANEDNPKTFNIMDRGYFEMSPDDIRKFKQQTVKLAEFNNALGDEDYQLFLFAKPENLARYKEKYMTLR